MKVGSRRRLRYTDRWGTVNHILETANGLVARVVFDDGDVSWHNQCVLIEEER